MFHISKNKIPHLILGVVAAAGVIGFFGMGGRGSLSAKEKAILGREIPAPASSSEAPAASVSRSTAPAPASSASLDALTTPVSVQSVQTLLHLTGSLIADERSNVASNINGIVMEVKVDRGGFVRKGEVLAQLDPRDAQNDLEMAFAYIEELKVRLSIETGKELAPYDPETQPEVRAASAELDMAVLENERVKALYESKNVPKADYDRTRTDLEGARARRGLALQQARQLYQSYKTAFVKAEVLKKNLGDTTIHAPFDGWIEEKHVTAGERVSVNAPDRERIATLVRINPLRLSLTVPQQFIGLIRAGQKVQFHVDAFPGRAFEGEIRRLTPAVSEKSRSMIVEAEVPNADGVLRPGLFATAKLELPGRRDALFVPATSVIRQGEISKVFTVRDGAARETVVEVAEIEGARVQVRSGLSSGDRIVLDAASVKDGDRISSVKQ